MEEGDECEHCTVEPCYCIPFRMEAYFCALGCIHSWEMQQGVTERTNTRRALEQAIAECTGRRYRRPHSTAAGDFFSFPKNPSAGR